MKRSLLLLTIFATLSINVAKGQDKISYRTVAKSEVLFMEGTIAKQPTSVSLELQSDSLVSDLRMFSEVEGEYYYDSKPEEIIELKGSVVNGNLTLHEVEADGKMGGIFKLNADMKGVLQEGKAKKRVVLAEAKGRVITSYGSQRDVFVDSIAYEYEGENGVSTADFSFETFKVYPNSAVADSINADCAKELAFHKEQAAEIYHTTLEWIDEEGYGPGSISDELKYEVNFVDNKVLSVTSSGYVYAGGAHGVMHVNCRVYSLETGKIITLADLIKNLNDDALVSLLHKKLVEYSGGDQHYFDLPEVRLNENFIVDGTQLIFTYAPYEVTSYAGGMPEVSFSFEELAPFMKEGSPLSYLL